MKRKVILFSLLLILTYPAITMAQPGDIFGTVTDASTQSTLPGATLVIAGTNSGAITNLDGEYKLLNVPEGIVEIQVAFIGYETQLIPVEVKAGETSRLDVEMMVESIGLNEVVVTAMMLGQTKAINQQLSSDAMVNVVSENKIKELPDANAAEAIGRLPGISLTRDAGEGSKVVVRGMEPTFTNVTVNGVRLAASSGNDRSTDLSMISSEMLSGVEVYKSPTPDMDGESIGGTVNLSVRKARDKPVVKIKGANIYNGLRNDFANYQASAILGKRFFDSRMGVIAQFNSERINRGTDNVSGTVESDVLNGITTPKWSQASKNSTWEYRKRYGGSLNLDYKLKGGGIFFSSFYNRTDRDGFDKKRTFNFSEYTSAYSLSSYETIKDVFSNSLSGEHTFIGTKLSWVVASSSSTSDNAYDLYIDYLQTDALQTIDDPFAHISELFEYSIDSPDNVRLDGGDFKPDTTFERNITAKVDWEIPFKLGNQVSGFIKTGGKYRIIDRWSRTHRWKSGMYYLGGSAIDGLSDSYGGKDFILTEDNKVSMSNFLVDGYNQDEFMNGKYDFYYPMDPELIEEIWEKDGDNWNYYGGQAKEDEYSAYERLTAGYLMAKINIFKSLTLIPGVRLEYSDNDYEAYQTEGGSSQATVGANAIKRTSNMQYLVVLPHLHMKFKPVSWFDARLAINKTVGRPKFNQVIPNLRFNPAASIPSITAGNTGLNPTLSTNYDFSVSFYKGTLGLISAGVFYKDIKDHIYKRSSMVLRTDSIAAYWGYPDNVDWALTTYDNMDAKAYGYELELQSVLKFLPAPLNGIVVNVNYSRQYTEALYQNTRDTIIYYVVPGSPIPGSRKDYVEEFRTAPMVHQTPDMFNFSIGYDYKGFSGRVSAIFQNTRISSINVESELKDEYIYKTWQWDASLKYTFKKRYTVFALLNNFSNRADITYIYDTEYFTKNKQYGYNIICGVQVEL